jgi:16S rRNA A1518/A1519 N6-dimethyltransferase RsmA/KsgA/DIM1 with predicted DNA glycosylase/AP lyase activity
MCSKNKIDLVDQNVLKKISSYIEKSQGPFVQVGSGSGRISKYIPEPRTLIEPHLRESPFKKDKNYEDYEDTEVIQDYFQNVTKLKHNCKTFISNLPFDQAIEILFHSHLYFPGITKYYVIVQKQVADKMLHSRKPLGFKSRFLFNMKKHFNISANCFRPVPKVTAVFLQLSRNNSYYEAYMKFLSGISSLRKKIKNTIPLLSDSKYSDLRLDQLEDAQVLDAFKLYHIKKYELKDL